MQEQQVAMFLNGYSSLCQQTGIMLDTWGQRELLILSPLYSERLNQMCSKMAETFLAKQEMEKTENEKKVEEPEVQSN